MERYPERREPRRARPPASVLALAASISLGAASLAAAADPPGPEEAPATRPALSIGGFTDFNFFATDDDKASPQSGFQEGQFTLHFTSRLSRRLSFFGEVTLSARPTEFRTEVERTILKYDHRDELKLSIGRYHTPINWWNNEFHHGQWLQTTVARPEMTRFGGDFIPVHFVGGLAEGTLDAGSVSVGYKAGFGNGRHTIVSRAGDSGDANNARAWLVGASIQPDALYQLEVGGAYYDDRITLAEGAGSLDESIVSAYAVFTRETPEVLFEYARIWHDDRGSDAEYEHDALYVQGAYRLPWWDSKVKPYVRYEWLEIEAGDPAFASLADRESVIEGVRLDLAAFACWKVEARQQQTAEGPHVDSVFTQVAFVF